MIAHMNGNDGEIDRFVLIKVSSLTRGPVAPSDMVGHSDPALISRHCDTSGRLLRASSSATSVDSTFSFRSFENVGV